MRNNNRAGKLIRAIPGSLAAGLVLLALAACGNEGSEAQGSPTAPPGMFSTLPTTEHPAAGDQAPTIELNTPEPTFTPLSQRRHPTRHTRRCRLRPPCPQPLRSRRSLRKVLQCLQLRPCPQPLRYRRSTPRAPRYLRPPPTRRRCRRPFPNRLILLIQHTRQSRCPSPCRTQTATRYPTATPRPTSTPRPRLTPMPTLHTDADAHTHTDADAHCVTLTYKDAHGELPPALGTPMPTLTLTPTPT